MRSLSPGAPHHGRRNLRNGDAVNTIGLRTDFAVTSGVRVFNFESIKGFGRISPIAFKKQSQTNARMLHAF